MFTTSDTVLMLVMLSLGPLSIPRFGGFGGSCGGPGLPLAFVNDVNDASDESLCVKPSGVRVQLVLAGLQGGFSKRSLSNSAKNDAL